MFHDINRSTAKRTFSYLCENYNIISLQDYIQAIEKQDKSKIPNKALIITFDDGRIENYRLLGLIKKFRIPITIFLCAGVVDTDRHFWGKLNDDSIDIQGLKKRSNKERLEILSEAGFKQDKEFDEPQALQRKHIEEMKQYVDMQSHTIFHPILPRCSTPQARKEIFGSKKLLENNFKLKIDAISFPNGDYSKREIQLVKEAGYRCAVTVDFGFNTMKTDPFRLKRLSMNDTDDINELIVKSSGVWDFFKDLI